MAFGFSYSDFPSSSTDSLSTSFHCIPTSRSPVSPFLPRALHEAVARGGGLVPRYSCAGSSPCLQIPRGCAEAQNPMSWVGWAVPCCTLQVFRACSCRPA